MDFLIVTALDVETKAVKRLLEEPVATEHDTLGKITKEDAMASHTIALTEIGVMGKDVAQAIAGDAIARLKPERVIMTGIAAGFPESGVGFGDLVVPYSIVNYELAKVKEVNDKTEYEHRDDPIPVGLLMWHAANTLAHDAKSKWGETIDEPRPDGRTDPPAIHSKSGSVLGSGDKLVASELAEQRKWLLGRFNERALGLEMESYGVLTACRLKERPFLMIKGSQDPATAGKDIPGTKDQWRPYAAAAAAAFTVALIRRANFDKTPDIVSTHMQEVLEVTQVLDRDSPKPDFEFTISRAESFLRLMQELYDTERQDRMVLIPNDTNPAIALHGGGGTGKTRIIRSLLGPLIDNGFCPVLLDLKKYSTAQHSQNISDPNALVREILLHGSVPRRSADDLRELARNARLAVLIDGLNEVSKEARTVLMAYFRQLDREGRCYQVGADRYGPPDSIEAFSHAAVDRLQLDFVEKTFDTEIADGVFERFDFKVKEIYGRPFFLALALKYRKSFKGTNISSIFQDFFSEQLGLSPEELTKLASATFKSSNEQGGLDVGKLKKTLGHDLYHALIHNEVLDKDESGFEHELWRDYLLSRHLAHLRRDKWTESVFDLVTTFSYSLEPLRLTLEQLDGESRNDDFLKAVVDWNYVAAADCIRELRTDVSDSIRIAILAAVAEKRFDRVQRTRKRANDIFLLHQYDLARSFADAPTPEALVELVSDMNGSERWFKDWKALFTKIAPRSITNAEVKLITDKDALLGWASANLARRSRLSRNQQKRLCSVYRRSSGIEQLNSTRWRIVHVLGAFPSATNARMLAEVLGSDSYHWVQYGAARALMEVASSSVGTLRRRILTKLGDFLDAYDPPYLWMRRQLMREVIESAFIRHPKLGWKVSVSPLLALVVEKETDQTHKKQLAARVAEFQTYDETD